MAYFTITYSDGHTVEFDNVISASYISNEKQNITVDQDLDQYPFPIGKPLWLHTGKSTVTVSGDGMRLIEVSKE